MTTLKWWQKAIFYQVYPRSFADATGDGIGDLLGCIERLDYLKELGVDAIWLSPHYPSPMVDCGYDISDYTAVAPEYGTLADFQQLLHEAHARQIRIILDLVLNHTSDQHAWFEQSRSSRDNPKADWYIWRDPVNGGPPNNWWSTFGGSAWEYEPRRNQYYYHFFFKEQPDLNWRNPAVRKAMYDAIRFWFDMGVDGFRIDAIGTVFEREDMLDHRGKFTQKELFTNAFATEGKFDMRAQAEAWEATFGAQVDQPEMIEVLRELRKVADEYEDRLLLGETERLDYCGDDLLHLVFNFNLMRTERITPAWVRDNQAERLEGLKAIPCGDPGAWPCNTIGNHDSPRIHNRFGDGANDDEINRVNLALLFTLKGTPFLYNGEEIGMTDFLVTGISRFRDTLGMWFYHLYRDTGMTEERASLTAADRSRDKNRTPMQWSNAPNGGFCPPGVEPWLPVNPNYATGVNVAQQDHDPASLLNYYRRMAQVRRANPALTEGDYVPVHEESTEYLAFLRTAPQQTILVVLNMSAGHFLLDFTRPGMPAILSQGKLIFSSRPRSEERFNLAAVTLGSWEVLLLELKP